MRRKLSFAVFNILIGLVIMYQSFDFGITNTLIYFIIIILIYHFFFEINIKYVLFIIFGCALMMNGILMHFRDEAMPFVGSYAICRGYVTSESVNVFGESCFDCKLDEISFQGKIYNEKNYRISVSCKSDVKISVIGKRVEFRCKINIPKRDGAKSDYRNYLYGKDISYVANTRSVKVLRANDDLRGVVFNFLNRIIEKRNSFLSYLDYEDRGLFAGVMLGEKSILDKDVYEEFRSTGTAHVLAVSGLHLGIIYSIYTALREKCKYKKAADLLLCFFLLLYSFLSLFSISVMRAVFVIMIKLTADMCKKKFDLLSAVSFAFLVFIIKNPYRIFDMGMQLSFLSLLIIIFVNPHIKRLRIGNFLEVFILPVGISVYSAAYFGKISCISVFANLPVIFLVSLYVPIGLICFFSYFIFGYFTYTLEFVESFLGRTIVNVNHSLYLIQNGSLEINLENKKIAVLFYLSLFFLSSEYFYIHVVSRFEIKKCIGFVLAAVSLFLLI